MNVAELASPWWYRQRGSVFGAIYGLGYFLGYLLGGSTARPVSVAWGGSIPGGHGAAIVLWCGVASALVAWFWRAWGTAYLKSDVVFAADMQSDKLIVAGPFRFVRNPLYLGNMFLAVAGAVLAPPLGFAIIIVGNAVLGVMLANHESRLLALRYGSVYEAFRAAVPPFVPRLTPATVPGSVSVAPAWRAALLGEGFCLTIGIAIVPIALFGTAGIPAFWAIYILTFVVFGFAGWKAGRIRSNLAKPGA
jgi:protein-S-isoprenylcysteine O-methyltransferase Ste14